MTEDGSKDPEKEQEKFRPGLPEKKTLIIAGIAIALFLIGVIAVFVIIQAGQGAVKPGAQQDFTPAETGVSSVRTPHVPRTVLPTVTRTIRETPTIPATEAVPVDFILQPGVPVSCGLTCRQMDATLTNSGYMTAHTVCIAVSMHNSRNEIINLNGESTLNRCVGDIAGGQTITEPITINADCGAFATRCIGETLTLQTQVTSDEKTVRFPDQIISV
ncbi:MAG: hypothetical protein NTZ37_09115 [Methanoregula sp.]|nr:hypothetical protein [Methanoregula sp.]